MKTSLIVSAIVASVLTAPFGHAQDKHSHDKPAAGTEDDKPMGQMRERMKAMQAQMDKIHKTADPKERQKLMQAHMQAMQENMKAMRGMGSMGGGMAMGDKKGGMKDGDMMRRHTMMENRMDMMLMMMEQMMQRDQVMQSMPAK